jgi:pyruvate dehydrogenase E1 component alpha subunit
MYRDRLLGIGVGEDELAGIESEVAAAVERATREAREGATPGADLMMSDVWADGGSAWRN